MRRRYVIIGLIVLLVGIAGWVVLKPLRVWYLTRSLEATKLRLHEALAAERAGESPIVGSTELSQRLRDLCEHLVDAGYFFHAQYEMDTMPHTEAAYYAILDRWTRTFPNSPYTTLAPNAYVFDVYDVPSARPNWEAFHKKYNVPDFVELYVAPPAVETEPVDAAEP